MRRHRTTVFSMGVLFLAISGCSRSITRAATKGYAANAGVVFHLEPAHGTLHEDSVAESQRRGCGAPRPRTRDNRTESPCRPEDKPETLTYKPGSQTETLATASQRPIHARWHTSALCDYAESFYEGTYQRHQAQFDRDFQSFKKRIPASSLPKVCQVGSPTRPMPFTS
jgi:hypothetical protein